MTRFQPASYLETHKDQPAVIMGDSGITVSFAELEKNSLRYANVLLAAGLRRGDHVAIMMENHPRYFEIFFAAQRIGLYTTPINWHLKAEEAGYIIEDCGAEALVVSHALAPLAAELEPHLGNVRLRLMTDGVIQGFHSYEEALAASTAAPIADEVEGSWMFYSSGTTGRPKGIKPPLPLDPFGTSPGSIGGLMQTMYGFTPTSTYLCPAPLYHAAPLGWSTTAIRLGATVVCMEKFEPEKCLQLIQDHRVTHVQFVPTHFVRMLKLPTDVRESYDHSSLQTVIHAAAPCPVDVKYAMIDWWGPIIYEFYAGSEGNGFCALNSEEWLAHPGSVGKPLTAIVHVLDEEGNELPTGEAGQIWFESAVRFEYHNDPAKTANAFNEHGWSSLGDIGYVDDEGYVYLTDRASHMIISGGVNIYPQEIENLLALHPKISDVAVIGVPNADFGEEVKAVVTVAPGATPGDHLEREIIDHCRQHLARYKCPVSVDFVDELPRLPTGKLLKRELRQRYWPA